MSLDIGAIALTGTIGAGKTTLAEAISEKLHEQGIRHALLDLDWLGQIYPIPEGHDPFGYELALANLKEIWPKFRAAGAGNAVIAGTLLNREQRNRLEDALGETPVTVALVTAPTEVVEARIRNRNSGPLLEDFLARTAQVARDIEAASIHDLEVQNDGKTPAAAAEEVLRTLRLDMSPRMSS